MKTNKSIKGWLHGECVLREATLPKDAVPEQQENTKNILVNGKLCTILADSETTGNHHVLDLEGVELFNKGDTRYFRSSSEMEVKCVHADRHDTITLPPGTYQIGFQQEYDYISESLRNVRD